MEQLKNMKAQLTSIVQGQMSNLAEADCKELGEAVDMIKDLAEAIYYCSITEAMEGADKKEKSNQNIYYYTTPPAQDYGRGRMYYGGMSNPVYYGGDSNYPSYDREPYRHEPRYEREYEIPKEMMMRDYREGKSPVSRKMYMESKEMHKDQAAKMKDLDKYIKELSDDIVEMIEGATPEEKQLLQTKIATLANKLM